MPETTPGGSDRNLLFGILALQMDFIDRDTLVRGMHAWILDKAKPLGQVFREQGALAEDTHALLEALVAKHLALHGGDAQRSLAAVSSLGSVRDDLRRIDDAEVQASLVHVSAARRDGPGEGATPDPDATPPLPAAGQPSSPGLRFRILRPHARGGLGQVYVAFDQELHREVALKEIQTRHAFDPDSRARFLLEAEVTGGLEHPGVVPVYGLGKYPDGRPYYAMRFIKGDSLQQAIDRFHAAEGPGRDPGERRLALRQLLRRFLDVCNAVAYAHSRGVLHRDLKPANVMLGTFGETLVVDWGLAKVTGRAGDGAEGAESPLRPTSGSGVAETVAGQALGTPAFMSPEQAQGRLDQLGPASDVYSLGATLYALLTGRPPIPDGETAVVLHKAARGEVVPPRQANRQVPPALAAVCLKALALRPQDRYGTALALAAEVEHWLADEPVSAYRERWGERAGRWMRRHRTKVTAAVVALAVAVATLTTATGLLLAANERERKAKEKANESFRLALEAVNQFFTQVSESPEMKARGLEKLREKLLNQANEFCERLSNEVEGKEPEVQAERARAFHSLGRLYYNSERYDKAETAYQQALDMARKVAAGPRGVTGHRYLLAKTLSDLGTLYQYRIDRQDQAVKAYQEAVTIWRELTASHPGNNDFRAGLASVLQSLGTFYHEIGRNGRAEEVNGEALAIIRELLAGQPHVPDYRVVSAGVIYNQGCVYSKTGRNHLAEKAFQQALDIQRKLVTDHPDVPDRRYELINTFRKLGWLYRNTERNELAEKTCREALSVIRSLAPENPALDSLDDLSALMVAQAYLAEPVQLLRQTVEEACHKFGPEDPKTLLRQNQLAWVLEKQGQAREAERIYLQTLKVQRRVRVPNTDTVWTQLNLAVLLARQGKKGEAETLCRQILGSARVQDRGQPQTPFNGTWRGKWKGNRGESGEDRLTLQENADGTITGDWTDGVHIRGERLGKSSFVFGGNNESQVYQGVGLVQDGTLWLYHSSWMYFGWSELTKTN
jgi:serine/threonine-protein kinase